MSVLTGRYFLLHSLADKPDARFRYPWEEPVERTSKYAHRDTHIWDVTRFVTDQSDTFLSLHNT